MALVGILHQRASMLGFDAFGITPADARPDLPEKLQTSLENNWHGTMEWMQESALRRASPKILWPEVKSIIMLGMNYTPDTDPIADLEAGSAGNISVYARNRDYHQIIKGKLKELAGLLVRHGNASTPGTEVKVFVDTAPVMEKPLAQSAGLGWQGKHSVLVSRQHGSWLFLGAIFTNLVLPASIPSSDACGTCRRCLDICPTNAFPAPYQLDARKCLAYYNNEYHGLIPQKYRKAMGNRIFGCDDCLAVCPWNKFASQTHQTKLQARSELTLPPLHQLVDLDKASFSALFSGSPVKRLGHARFLRNVLIALGNSGDVSLLKPAEKRLEDEDPLIRGTAVWAVRQLASFEYFSRLHTQHGVGEKDPQVAGEWQQSLKPSTANSSLSNGGHARTKLSN